MNGELIPSGGGDPIPLIRERLSIGRRDSCDICLRLPNVSGLHCEIYFKDGYWYVRDLGSTNGVKVNGLRVQHKLLHPGDEILIAKRRWTIQYALQAGRRVLEELEEEDVMSQSLLERAGLERKKPKLPERPATPPAKTGGNFDPGEFLLDEGDK